MTMMNSMEVKCCDVDDNDDDNEIYIHKEAWIMWPVVTDSLVIVIVITSTTLDLH